MNAQTHTPRVSGDSTVRRQLDMLAAGQMDQATFLRATIARLRDDPDENWEVLSLLDQYFRLNKISGDTFRAVKNGLAEFVLRPRGAAPVHTPVPPQTVQIPRPAPQAHASPAPTPGAAVTQPTFEPKAAPVARPASPVTPAAASIVLETPVPPDRDLVTGDVLRGRYRIESFVGQGGRGMVYAATDSYRLDSQPQGQRVAIKLLQRSIAKRPDAVLELRREFQLLQSLTHPNIVRAHEFDRDGALSFFTMELLNGVLLTRVALARRQRPLSRAHALALVRDIGAAMSFAHSRGVVHGDINPQNIFVTFDGEVRVLDFGAARRTRRDAAPFIGEEEAHGSFATLGYASPQVMGGQHAEVQDDVFSLACVAYTLFSGRHPFNEASSLHAQAARQKPKRLGNMKDGPWRALRQALQFDRSKRPESVADFLERLDLSQAAHRLPNLNDLLESQGSSRHRVPWAALAAGVLVLGGATYAYLVREDILPAPGFGAAHPLSGSVLVPAADAPDELAPAGTPQPAAPVASTPVPPATSAMRGTPVPQTTAPAPRTETPLPATTAMRGAPISQSTAPAPHTETPPPAATAMRGAPVPPTTAPAPHTDAPTSAMRTPVPEASSPAPAGLPAPAAAAPLAARTEPATAVPPAAGAAAPGAAATPRIATTARVELTADTVDVTADDVTAHIVVHRRGTLRGEAPFTWWTESGTAKPGTDFEAVASHVDRIPDGAATATLNVTLVQTLRGQPKSFYVVIDQTDGGATVSGRTLTMVTLPESN